MSDAKPVRLRQTHVAAMQAAIDTGQCWLLIDHLGTDCDWMIGDEEEVDLAPRG